VPLSRCTIQRSRELVEFDLIGVLLCGVRARMPHQRLQRDGVAAACSEEPVGKGMPQLVWREPPDAGALADTPDHAHQRLIARGPLRILPAPLAIVRRHPLLYLDGEHMVVELGLQLAETRAQLVDDVGGGDDGQAKAVKAILIKATRQSPPILWLAILPA